MQMPRRHFLGGAAASVAALQFSNQLLASGEPRRVPANDVQEVLLNSNENAYGPFPSVLRAMQDGLRFAHRYPDSHFDALWETLAAAHKVSKERIFLGCGSTDILRMAADSFTGAGHPLVTASPGFEALVYYAQRNQATITKVPLRPDHAHDLEKMLESARNAPSLLYICNPNNPTGSLTPRGEIEQFIVKLPENAHVIIDEAYHHFVTDPTYRSFADDPLDDPRVIVARTFSKVFGMAGMRVGYALSHPQTIEKLGEHYVFDNPNVIGAMGATAGMRDVAEIKAASQRIIADRNLFAAEVHKRKLKMIPSQANFVMIDSGRPVRQAIGFFAERKIRIGRPFPPYDTHARISLGTPSDMLNFWRVWDQFAV